MAARHTGQECTQGEYLLTVGCLRMEEVYKSQETKKVAAPPKRAFVSTGMNVHERGKALQDGQGVYGGD